MTLADPPIAPAAPRRTLPPPAASFDVPPAAPLRMTEQEYLDWVDESGRTEWVAGEVIFKMPIGRKHDVLQRAISSSMEAFAQPRGLGEVCGEKWAMRLPQRPSWREADVIFVAKSTSSR